MSIFGNARQHILSINLRLCSQGQEFPFQLLLNFRFGPKCLNEINLIGRL